MRLEPPSSRRQANEAIKLVLGKGRTLQGRLLLCDALEIAVREPQDPKKSGVSDLCRQPIPLGDLANRLSEFPSAISLSTAGAAAVRRSPSI